MTILFMDFLRLELALKLYERFGFILYQESKDNT